MYARPPLQYDPDKDLFFATDRLFATPATAVGSKSQERIRRDFALNTQVPSRFQLRPAMAQQQLALRNLQITVNEPLVVNFLLTNRCPLRCRYCFAADLDNHLVDIDSLLLQRVAAVVGESGVQVVVLSGGEPLLSPHLNAAIAMLSAITNVVLDTSGFIDLGGIAGLLKECSVHVRVSLDAINERIQRRVRPSACGDSSSIRAIENIGNLVAQGIPTTVQTVVTTENVQHLPKMYRFLNSQGIRKWLLREVTMAGLAIANKELKPESTTFNRSVSDLLAIHTADVLSGKSTMILSLVPGGQHRSVLLLSPDGTWISQEEQRKVSLGSVSARHADGLVVLYARVY